jgi:ribosomal-protein-alanine N-acetyltransferase
MFGFLRRPLAVAIEPLRSNRAPDCARIHAMSFAHPWDASEFETLLAAGNVIAECAVGPADRRLHGFVLSRQAADEAEILTIAVAKASRRRKVAGALLRAHLATLRRKGVKKLFLEVGENNPAGRALYDHAGFVEAGRREGYYRQGDRDPVAALILRKDLW